MDIWRQAYIGSGGSLRPAAKLCTMQCESIYVAKDMLRKTWGNLMWPSKHGLTYCGLKLFDSEEAANEVVFNIKDVHI